MLGVSGRAEVEAWLAAHRVDCAAEPQRARVATGWRCIGELPVDLLSSRQSRGKLTQLVVTALPDAPIFHLTASRQHSLPVAAGEDYAATVTWLEGRLGAPSTRADAGDTDLTGPVVHLATHWVYDDLEVEVALMRFGSPSLSVSETWTVPGIVAPPREAGDRGGAPSHAPVPGPRPPDTLTIASLHASKASLAQTAVAAHGRIVKANHGIFGTNWYHLWDGSGSDGTDDLTFTADAHAEVGDIVTVRGTLTTDKDLGFGYFFPVIIEEAEVVPR